MAPRVAQPPTIQERIDGISSAHQATRHVTLPLFVGGGVVVLGLSLHYAWTPLAIIAWVAAACFVIVGYDNAARLRRDDEAAQRAERIWALGCVTAIWVGLVFWAWTGLWSWPDLIGQVVVSTALLLPCGIPWTWNRRIRRGVQVDASVNAFSRAVLDSLGLRGVDIPKASVVAGEDWYEFDLDPQTGGWTERRFQATLPALAAEVGVDETRISMWKKGERKGRRIRMRVRVDQSSVAPAPTCYALPDAPTDIRRPYRKGELEGGGDMLGQHWRAGHGSIGGLRGGLLGGGKTSALELDSAYVVTSANALLWAWDGKPGQPNWKKWGDRSDGLPALVDWLGRTPEDWVHMIRAAWAIATTRGQDSEHEPTARAPYVKLICDESAIVFAPELGVAVVSARDRMAADRIAGDVVRATEQYVQVYRSTGTSLDMATVRCEQKSTGNATIRSFLIGGERVCFSTSNPRDGEFLFPGEDVPAHTLPRDAAGSCYLQNHQHPRPVRGRYDKFDHDKITKEHPDNDVQRLRRWVAEHPESQPVLDDTVRHAIRSEVGDAYDKRWGPAPLPDGVDDTVWWPRCSTETCGAEQTSAELLAGHCLACGHELTDAELQMLAVSALQNEQNGYDPDAAVAADAAALDQLGILAEPQDAPAEPAPAAPLSAPRRYSSADESRQHILDALVHLGEGWHSTRAVLDALGGPEAKAQQTIANRLRELRERGAVERRGKRNAPEWRAVRSTVTDPTMPE